MDKKHSAVSRGSKSRFFGGFGINYVMYLLANKEWLWMNKIRMLGVVLEVCSIGTHWISPVSLLIKTLEYQPLSISLHNIHTRARTRLHAHSPTYSHTYINLSNYAQCKNIKFLLIQPILENTMCSMFGYPEMSKIVKPRQSYVLCHFPF